MSNLNRIYRLFFSVSTALAIAFVFTGCGGSSNGDPTQPPAPTQPQASAEEVAGISQYAVGLSQQFSTVFNVWQNPEAIDIFSAADFSQVPAQLAEDHAVVVVTSRILEIASDVQNIGVQQFDPAEICDQGSIVVTEAPDAITIDLRACRIKADEEIGIELEIFANGKATFREAEPASGYDESIRLVFDKLTAEVSIGRTLSANVGLDGQIWMSATDELNGQIDIIRFEVAFGGKCRDLSEDLAVTMDTIQTIAPDGSGGVETRIFGTANVSGTLAGGFAGVYEIETLVPVRYDRWGDPYMGKTRITYGTEIVEVEYVEGGLFVNGKFYDLWDFEDDYMEFTDQVEALLQCVIEELDIDLDDFTGL